MTVQFRVTRKRVATTVAVALVAALILIISACTTQSSNGAQIEGAAQSASTQQQEQNQPPPVFPTSAIKQELIEIEAIQALGTPTTTFFFPEGTSIVNVSGKQSFSAPPFKTCPSEGEPIPNTASLTNPLTPYVGSINTGSDDPVVDQQDPNGIYVPAASSGTYVLCETASGGTRLDYWEGPVYSESGSAIWDASTGQVTEVGPANLPVCTALVASAGDGTKLAAGTSYTHCVKA